MANVNVCYKYELWLCDESRGWLLRGFYKDWESADKIGEDVKKTVPTVYTYNIVKVEVVSKEMTTEATDA